MNIDDLTERQRDLVRATVQAWEATSPGPAHQPLQLGSLPLEHPNWPEDVERPRSREEFRSLNHLGWLVSDPRGGAGLWVLSPSAEAIDAFGAQQRDLRAELDDADLRLGVIHEAVVRAYEAAPSEPLHLAIMDPRDIVSHPGWPLPPDAGQEHDFTLLAHAGLVLMTSRGIDYAITPTPLGRDVINDPERALETVIEQTSSPERRSRIQTLLDKVRAGEIAANAAGGGITTAAVAIVNALAT